MAKANKATKSSGLFPDALVQTLLSQPNIKTVYLNDKGEWHFVKRPGFEAFQSSEILECSGDKVTS